MKLRSFLTTTCIVAAFICLPSLIWAQGGPGPDPDPGNTSAPFDGGITMLIAAGIGYASKKAHDKRKKEKAVVNQEK